MAKGERWTLSRIAPGADDLERLLREARAYKGESLWNDAWRRLRHNRAALWCLGFLAFAGLASLLAPLWPAPSPMALDLLDEPRAPSWPWEQSERLDLARDKELGSAPSRALRSFADDGWQHRALLAFAGPPDAGAALEALVEGVSGRRAVVHAAPDEDAGPDATLYRIAVPLVASDAPRVDFVPTGATGTLRLGRVAAGEGASVAWCSLDLPAVRALSRWRVQASESGIRADVSTPDGDLRYVFELEDAADLDLALVRLNGLDVAPEGEPDEPLALPLPGGAPLEPRVALTLALDGPGSERAFELEPAAALVLAAPELRAVVHDDLGRRVAAAFAQSPPEGTTFEGMRVHAGYWELGPIDETMVWLRGRVFGLWQSGNWLGTDSKGRDLFARILWGSRISIQVALMATLCSLLIGVTYGAFSGLVGGRVDNLMMRIVDILYAIPFIFVVIFVITLINERRAELADKGIEYMHVFYVVVGLIYWLTMARVVRGQVLSLKGAEFIEATRALGASTPRILFVHIVPNVLSVVIVYLTLTIPAVMLFEAFLSFLGLGVEPPKVSWGLLAVDGTEAFSPIKVFWWLVVWPAVAMGSTLLALNVLGDGLRDALDPKLRGKT